MADVKNIWIDDHLYRSVLLKLNSKELLAVVLAGLPHSYSPANDGYWVHCSGQDGAALEQKLNALLGLKPRDEARDREDRQVGRRR